MPMHARLIPLSVRNMHCPPSLHIRKLPYTYAVFENGDLSNHMFFFSFPLLPGSISYHLCVDIYSHILWYIV
jgi:hypothetical protein